MNCLPFAKFCSQQATICQSKLLNTPWQGLHCQFEPTIVQKGRYRTHILYSPCWTLRRAIVVKMLQLVAVHSQYGALVRYGFVAALWYVSCLPFGTNLPCFFCADVTLQTAQLWCHQDKKLREGKSTFCDGRQENPGQVSLICEDGWRVMDAACNMPRKRGSTQLKLVGIICHCTGFCKFVIIRMIILVLL